MSISTIPPRGKGRHAHRGSGRTLVGGEIGREDFVHPGVIALEVGQENAHANDIGKRQPAALEHAAQIIHHLARLGLDARRNEERIIIRIGRELSGHEYECSGLDGVAVRRDRLRCVGQKMKARIHVDVPWLRCFQRLPLAVSPA